MPMSRGPCLVTGGLGFLGAHLVQALLARGGEVRVMDVVEPRPQQKRAWSRGGNIRFLKGDVRDPVVLEGGARGVQTVFHLAAMQVAQCARDPAAAIDFNVHGTYRVARAAAEAGARRMVFASSATVYGRPDRLPVKEDDPLRPFSVYAATKVSGEMFGRREMEASGLSFTALRFFNIYGPGQRVTPTVQPVVPAFVEKALAGESPTIFGDGKATFDFVHVSDAAQALVAAGTRARVGPAYNVGTGTETSLSDLWRSVAHAAGRADLKPTRKKGPPSQRTRADIGRARRDLCYRPRVPLEQGLADVIRWHRSLRE
ncbi:MAG: NAD-dependent epimerase/dehydratase family protein [Halobacteria archaeon]